MRAEAVAGLAGEIPGSIDWSPEGDVIACGAGQLGVLTHARNGTQAHLVGHSRRIASVRFAPSGRLLATVQEGSPAVVRVWETLTSACVCALGFHDSDARSIDWSPDGALLALLARSPRSASASLRVYDLSDVGPSGGHASLLISRSLQPDTRCARFSMHHCPDSLVLVACGSGNPTLIRRKDDSLHASSFDLGSGKWVPGTKNHVQQRLTCIAFSFNAILDELEHRRVVFATASGEALIANCASRKLERRVSLHTRCINDMLISSAFLATASDDGLVRVWPPALDDDFLLEAEHCARPTSLAASPDSLRIASAVEDGTLGALNVPTHAFTRLLSSHTGSISDVSLAKNLAATCARDCTVRLWNTADGALEQTLELDGLNGYQRPKSKEKQLHAGNMPQRVALNASANILAIGCNRGKVRIYTTPSDSTALASASSALPCSLVTTRKQHKSKNGVGVRNIAFLGDQLVTAGEEGSVCLYESETFEPSKLLATGLAQPSATNAQCDIMAVSTRVHMLALAVSDFSGARLFDASTCRMVNGRMELPSQSLTTMAFTSSGEHVILASDASQLHFFSVKSLECVRSLLLPLSPAVSLVALDGSIIATQSNGSLYAVPDGSAVEEHQSTSEEYVGHTQAVTAIASDASRLVSGDETGIMLLWNIEC